MIRRAAWRAVGLTEPPAAQRKKGRLHGRAAPFRGRTAPEAGELVAASGEPRRTGRRPLDAARRLRHPAAGRAPSRRAPAPRSAPPRPLHPWRGPGSARPRPRTAPAGSVGRRAIFPGGRRRRVRGAVGARRGAGGAVRRRRGRRGAPRGPADRGARGRGRAGTRYRAHRKNARAAFGARGGVFAAVQPSRPSQACWPSIARATSMNGAGVGALRRSKGGNGNTEANPD